MKPSEMPRYRQWLVVGRLQAIPVTLTPVILGYISSGGSVFDSDILVLCAIVALSHYGLMVQNEAFDAPYDKQAERFGKPIPYGDISRNSALVVSSALIVISVISLFVIIADPVAYVISGAILCASVYNGTSKSIAVSDILMGISLSLLVISGDVLHNSVTDTIPMIVAVHVFVLSILMHIVADLKDIGSGEESMYTYTDCVVDKTGDIISIYPSGRFIMVIFSLIILYSLFNILAILNRSGIVSPIRVSLDIVLLIGSVITIFKLNYPGSKKERKVELYIILFVLLSSMVVITVSSFSSDVVDIYVTLITMSSIPFITQKIQYGKAVYFP